MQLSSFSVNTIEKSPRFARRINMNQRLCRQLLSETAGCVLIAAAVYNFAVSAQFPMTGFSGISIILFRLFSIPIGLSTILLNLPVAALCCKLLGKSFFLRSLRCMLLSSLLIDHIAPLFPVYTGSRLLAALCTGVLGGIGYTLIYMHNASTGGSDFIIMSIKALYPHLSLGNIAFWSDVGIILLGGILFEDADGIIYGMIVNFLFAVMTDKMIYGANAGKLALIITDHGKKMCAAIAAGCSRGSTVMDACGGYRGEKRQIVLCACSNREIYLLTQTVKETDPDAFLVILESGEVHGNGFRTLSIGEKKEVTGS